MKLGWPGRQKLAVGIFVETAAEACSMGALQSCALGPGHVRPLTNVQSTSYAPHTPADLGLNIFYTVEMIMRIVSLGPPWFWTYIKRPWNMFDFFMVAAGYTAFIPADAGGGLPGHPARQRAGQAGILKLVARVSACWAAWKLLQAGLRAGAPERARMRVPGLGSSVCW